MKYIVISGSSDIGNSIIKDLSKNKEEIIYTYNSKKLNSFKNTKGYKLDISSRDNIKEFAKSDITNNWDHLIILPATLKPIGLFSDISGDEWAKSVDLNFTNQIFIIRELMSKRSKTKKIKSIILCAGGAVNDAPPRYSAYMVSKIAQIKMAELLDKEFEDVKVSIIGPGTVKTKIHKQTLESKALAGYNHKKITERFKKENFHPMKDVVSCFKKIISLNKKTVGGRNISAEYDDWRTDHFIKILDSDQNIYKLRRDFNDFQISDLNFNLAEILEIIHKNKNFQNPSSLVYKTFKRLFNLKFTLDFFNKKKIKNFLNLNINFPYIKFGNINSAHLFGIDELLIFKFYISKKRKYKKVCDIGANIGLHSLILSKCGYKVDSYEPDPTHCRIAKKIFRENKVKVNLIEKAVANYTGNADFTRIVNNTTGSYIGDKKESYGPTEIIKVNVINAEVLSGKYDFIKIDAEGSEFDILRNFKTKDFKKTDFMIEISTELSRKNLWKMMKKNKLKFYSQKKSWDRVKKITDLPTSHREGAVFISSSNYI